MSLSHCIHQTLNSKASTRFHSGGLQQSCTLILNPFLFGVIILIANILKRAFSSQLAAKLRNRLLVLYKPFFVPFGAVVYKLGKGSGGAGWPVWGVGPCIKTLTTM